MRRKRAPRSKTAKAINRLAQIMDALANLIFLLGVVYLIIWLIAAILGFDLSV